MASQQVAHRSLEITTPIDPGWSVIDPPPGVVLVQVATDSVGGYRANLVLAIDELEDEIGFEGWQSGNEALLRSSLEDYLLIDLGQLDVAGFGGIRRISSHLVDGVHAVTFDQRSVLLTTASGNTGISWTMSCATLQYPYWREAFESLSERLVITEGRDR